MKNTLVVVAIFVLTLFGFGCGSNSPVAPTPVPTLPTTVEIPPDPEPVPIPAPVPIPVPEPPESPNPPEMPEPEPPQTPDPEPEPDPDPEPSPPPTPTPTPIPPEPSPPPPPPAPSPPEVVGDYSIMCACDDVQVGDVIVLRVEHPDTENLTYRWAATPGSDPIPGDSPTPRWNPSGSGRVEITAWVTGDRGTVVVSRSVEVTGNPAPPPPPPIPVPPTPPSPSPPPEMPEPDPLPPTKPWGAYSASSNNTVYGVAAGKASPDDANRAAHADCRSKGGWGCASGSPFQNQCFAVAHGRVILSDPSGPPYPSTYYQLYVSLDEQTQRAAEQATMYNCVRGGGYLGSGTECKVLASVCQP